MTVRQDINSAVGAARAAFPAWSAAPLAERLGLLRRVCDITVSRLGPLASVAVDELGCPIVTALDLHGAMPIAIARIALDELEQSRISERVAHSKVVRPPIGVVAIVLLQDCPLLEVVQSVVPALAVGCTVIVATTEHCVRTSTSIAGALAEADLPTGVFSYLETTAELRAALVGHEGVEAVTVTGTGGESRALAAAAVNHLKPCNYQHGSRGVTVLLPGADHEKAVASMLIERFHNSGQFPGDLQCALVPIDEIGDVCDRAGDALSLSYTPNDPTLRTTNVGPLVTSHRVSATERAISQLIGQGAEVIASAEPSPRAIASGGQFTSSTVLFGRAAGMEIPELPGPALLVLGYETVDEAHRVASKLCVHHRASVWCGASEDAHEFARGLRASSIDVNGATPNFWAPSPGRCRSGSLQIPGAAFDGYRRLQTVQLDRP